MTAQPPEITIKKTAHVDEEIKQIYINYMQMMIDAAKDPKLMEELFSNNELRVKYLNEKVGMKVPEGTKIIFKTKNIKTVKVYVKSENGSMYMEEGPNSLKIFEKLNSGEMDTETLTLTSPKEVDVEVHESFKECNVVAMLPFLDPSRDLMLFELKFEDQEIVFTTCVPI